MPATIYEKSESRTGSGESETRLFMVQGADDEADAREQLLVHPEVPLTIHDDAFERDRFGIELAKRIRAGVYEFRVPYLTPELKQRKQPGQSEIEVGEWTFSFDTTGATGKVTQSLGTKAYTSAGRASGRDNQFGNAINVSGRGDKMKVDGVDIVIPSMKFELKYRFPKGALRISYAKKLRTLTGRVNSEAFPPQNMPFADEQFDPGELLFLGTNGSFTSKGEVDLTFAFDASENVQDLSTGDIISIEKNGHDFIWYRYKVEDDTTNNETVKKPVAAYVETVYAEDDLNEIFVT